MSVKMLHYPARTGMGPRPYDDYDRVCERYYHAWKKPEVRRECEAELRGRYGSDDLDMDYSHGRMIARDCRVVHES